MEWSTSVKNSVGFLVQVEQDLHATVRSSHFAQAAHDELCRSAVAARDCALSLRLQARSEMTRLECESLSQLERAVHERNAHAAAWRASNQLQLNQARAEEEKLAAQLSEMRGGVEAACQALAAMESRLQIAELPATPDARVWDEPAQDGALAAEVMSALHAVPGVEDGGVSMRTLAIELQYNVRLADALRLRTPVDRERFLSRVHDLVRARRNEHEQSWAGAGGAAIDDLVDLDAVADLVFSAPAEVALLLRGCRAAMLDSAARAGRVAPRAPALEEAVEAEVRRQLEVQVVELRAALAGAEQLSDATEAQLLAGGEAPAGGDGGGTGNGDGEGREAAEQAELRRACEGLRARREALRARKREARAALAAAHKAAAARGAAAPGARAALGELSGNSSSAALLAARPAPEGWV